MQAKADTKENEESNEVKLAISWSPWTKITLKTNTKKPNLRVDLHHNKNHNIF